MSTKLQNFKLPTDLICQLEDLSSGNKTSLVVDLLRQSIAMREIPESLREAMYVSVKKLRDDTQAEFCPKFTRTLIDALNI